VLLESALEATCESCRKHDGVTLHPSGVRRVTHMSESCYTYAFAGAFGVCVGNDSYCMSHT